VERPFWEGGGRGDSGGAERKTPVAVGAAEKKVGGKKNIFHQGKEGALRDAH